LFTDEVTTLKNIQQASLKKLYQKADHIGLFCCTSSNFCNQPELIGLSEELPLPLHTLTNKARVGIAIPLSGFLYLAYWN
jgi:hypothetical protein